MKNMKWLILTAFCALGIIACTNNNDSDNHNNTDEPVNSTFAKGADISWVTQMENDGVNFKNSSNINTDCFALMKEIGMNAIRLRVWVNPEDADWCGKTDVVNKAVRANELGMDVMIDFHYSDWWADPGKQNKPAAWEGMSLTQLRSAISSHTIDILNAIKAKGIAPKWVQVGNETRNGMLWPDGQLWNDNGNLNHWSQYAQMSNSGYNAAKSVFPNTIVIVHIDNGWEDNDWWFKDFKAAGGKWDMIGLSHYPQTHASKGWSEMNSLCLNHIKSLGDTYGTPVMICEIGTKQSNEALATQVMNDFMTKAKALNQCAGVFYWEPQVFNGWKPAIYNDKGWNAYDMGAFNTNGQPSSALNCFK